MPLNWFDWIYQMLRLSLKLTDENRVKCDIQYVCGVFVKNQFDIRRTSHSFETMLYNVQIKWLGYVEW